MIEKYTIDRLISDSVTVKKQIFIDVNGRILETEEPFYRAYTNSARGRNEVESELPQAQVNAIFSVWGDTPTVED